jgi:hypothetical protein
MTASVVVSERMVVAEAAGPARAALTESSADAPIAEGELQGRCPDLQLV